MSIKPPLVDPAFPRLEIAVDSESMRGVFQEHLRPIGDTTYQILDCRLSRIRYRRGARCVLQYTLRLGETDAEYERIQWVTGVMYADGVTRRKWEKLRSLAPAKIPQTLSTFEPFSFIPDLGMLVEVFPHDRRLPTLPLLMAGPSSELESPLLARFGPGDWHTEAWNAEPLRYRAELGATLRLTLRARDDATGLTDERRFYVKVYHDEGGEQTYRALRTLRSRADEDSEKFTVGMPIAYLKDLRALLQEETSGDSLEDLLLQDGVAPPAIRKVARALAALHLDHAPAPRRHPLSKEVVALERTGRLLRWVCPHLGPEIEETVDATIASLDEGTPGPTHLDLKLDHILLDGDRPALVDLDGFAEADPVLDVANILADLAGMRLLFPHEESWRMVARRFAEEYFTRVPEAWRDRLPTHYAGATLKVAVGFFRRQEPDWPDKVATLLEEAKDSLMGKVW